MLKLRDFFPAELRKEINRLEPLSPPSPSKKFNKLDNQDVDYAFTRLRKLPLGSVRQVNSALFDFDKIKGASEEEISQACNKIIKKATELEISTIAFVEKYKHLVK